MAYSAWTTIILVAWTLLAASGIASTPSLEDPSGSIEFSLEVQRRHESHDSDEGEVETIYGQLVGHRGPKPAANVRGTTSVNTSSTIVFPRADPGFPGVDKYGPLVRVPGCFFCPPQSTTPLTGRDLLESLSTDKMRSYMRVNEADALKHKCVFYTRALRATKYLSERASTWACAHQKFSIWVSASVFQPILFRNRPHSGSTCVPCPQSQLTARVMYAQHLWPNKIMAQEDKSQYTKDFYGIDEKDNWLHSIIGLPINKNEAPSMIQYFENMSEAMAQACSGEVVVMTQTSDKMGQYVVGDENIWKNKERPALQGLIKQGRVTRMLVV